MNMVNFSLVVELKKNKTMCTLHTHSMLYIETTYSKPLSLHVYLQTYFTTRITCVDIHVHCNEMYTVHGCICCGLNLSLV